MESAEEYTNRVAWEFASSNLTMREVVWKNTIARDSAIHADEAQRCADRAIAYCENNRLTKGWQEELRLAITQGQPKGEQK